MYDVILYLNEKRFYVSVQGRPGVPGRIGEPGPDGEIVRVHYVGGGDMYPLS